MAILYNLPRIGEQSPNKWGQRGPTCWYYVSKMLLKFHEKIQPASEHYESFKVMHELRKILTHMGEHDLASHRHSKARVIARLDQASSAQLFQINRRSAAIVDVKRKLRTAVGPTADRLRAALTKLEELRDKDWTELPRKLEAIEALRRYEDDDLGRAKIFESFFPDRTFSIVQADAWIGQGGLTPERLEECLANWGPCYAGGGFSVVSRDPPGAVPPIAGDVVVNVTQTRADSSHAIVIAGIDGNTVYYKDPNQTDQLLTCTFDLLRSRLSTDNNRLFISVACTPNPVTGRCTHMDTKTTRRPDYW